MRRRVLCCVVLLATILTFAPQGSAAQSSVTCGDFDAWVWAQTVFESDPDAYQSALDPDQNNIACENLPVAGGFAPVLWTDSIPADAVPAQVVSITDGDTFDVTINGQPDTIRMYHIDTPETTNFNNGPHCGGDDATAFLRYLLGFAPGGTVYLEYDVTERDRYDRRLAYVWFELGGDPYLVNDVMVRNGWAESETYEPDVKYKAQLNEAEQFSVQHVLGVRLECGRFNQPLDAQPSQEQVAQARRSQPDQGQFAAIAVPGGQQGSQDGQSSGSGQVQQPAPAPPTEPPPPAPAQTGNCDPSYPTVCIPPIGQTGDLDCGDVSYRRFQVVPPDPHNFDGDFDGVGCESG